MKPWEIVSRLIFFGREMPQVYSSLHGGDARIVSHRDCHKHVTKVHGSSQTGTVFPTDQVLSAKSMCGS